MGAFMNEIKCFGKAQRYGKTGNSRNDWDLVFCKPDGMRTKYSILFYWKTFIKVYSYTLCGIRIRLVYLGWK